ncbi:MAG: PilZ domain-containing protein [Negativicutes bacterium]|nr:PilZ domain-containing protein [Negativicutes bacterium]
MTDMKKIFFLLQKVDILVADAVSGRNRVFHSRIEDIADDSLTIAAPYSYGYYLPPRPGREVSARVTTDDCAFLFKVNLLSYAHNPVPLWTVSWPTDVERVQMRSYVRFDVNLDVRLSITDEETPKPILTMTKDISAGGLRVLMGEPLPVGSELSVALYLESDNVMEAKGEVVRIIRPRTEHEKYAVAIRYLEIDEKSRSQIIKFIFRKQIERRKKQQEVFDE